MDTKILNIVYLTEGLTDNLALIEPLKCNCKKAKISIYVLLKFVIICSEKLFNQNGVIKQQGYFYKNIFD